MYPSQGWYKGHAKLALTLHSNSSQPSQTTHHFTQLTSPFHHFVSYLNRGIQITRSINSFAANMVQRVLCFPGYGQNAATLDVKVTTSSYTGLIAI